MQQPGFWWPDKTCQFTPLHCTSTAYFKFSTRVPSAPLFLPSRKINLDHLCLFSEAHLTQHLGGTPKFKVSKMYVDKNSSSLISCPDNREQGQGVPFKVPWSPAGFDYTVVLKLAWAGASLKSPHFWVWISAYLGNSELDLYGTMTLNKTIVFLLREMQQSSLME